MLNTNLSFKLITRDIERSLDRVEADPTVKRDSEYYLKNITRVKSIKEFLADDRLFRFAMKAHGLSDMAYAKAFMKKALEEGVDSPGDFANKLNDPRYRDFVASFNFAGRKERATTYAEAQEGVMDRYTLRVVQAGVAPDNPLLVKKNADYKAAVSKIASIDEFLKNDAVYAYALEAFRLEGKGVTKAFMREILENGAGDPSSLANRQADPAFAQFAAAFNFAELGARATTHRPAVEGVMAKYARQVLEEKAGAGNEGVRLALYFQRKAPDIDNFYEVLADPALSRVVRTALSLPDSFASADIDKQVALFEQKLDTADFQDAKKLGKFLERFTSLWELGNPSAGAGASPAASLIGRPAEFGVSGSLLLQMQSMRR